MSCQYYRLTFLYVLLTVVGRPHGFVFTSGREFIDFLLNSRSHKGFFFFIRPVVVGSVNNGRMEDKEEEVLYWSTGSSTSSSTKYYVEFPKQDRQRKYQEPRIVDTKIVPASMCGLKGFKLVCFHAKKVKLYSIFIVIICSYLTKYNLKKISWT